LKKIILLFNNLSPNFSKLQKNSLCGVIFWLSSLGAASSPLAMTPSNDSIKQKKTVIASGDQARYPCFQKTADQWSSVL
ncbi:hypothetical protein, partial [Klebsiella pneumoniae]|uniref:hypothetical protein n=1 Tax=Klebsiella pneumoniae TaxID=573 RepID=UPI001CB728B1